MEMFLALLSLHLLIIAITFKWLLKPLKPPYLSHTHFHYLCVCTG